MHFDVCLRIDRIRKSGELRYTTEVREEVLSDVAGTRCTVDIFRVLLQRM